MNSLENVKNFEYFLKHKINIIFGIGLAVSLGTVVGIFFAGFIDTFTNSNNISLIIGIPIAMSIIYIIGYRIALQITKKEN